MATKRATIIPKAPVARIILNAGAKRVTQKAIDFTVELLEKKGAEIARQAVRNSKHAGRKTVHESDVKLAASE